MEHPFRWTIFCFVIYLVIKNDKICCQYINPNEGCAPSTAELISTLVKELSPAGRSQLVSALLTAASNSGILPELTSLVQPSQPIDNYAAATVSSVPQTMNVVPIVANIPTVCRSDPMPNATPMLNPSIESLYCIGLPPPPPPLEPLPQNDFSTYISSPQLVSTQQQPSLSDIIYSICTPAYKVPESSYQMPPPSPSLSYSSSSSPSSSTQSPKTVSSPSYLTSPITLPPSPPPSLPSSSSSCLPSSSPSSPTPSPPSSIPIINPQLDYVETVPNIGFQPNPFSSYYTCDSEFPVNLEINIPALSVPEPRITIVTAERPDPYPVVKKSSSLKKMLPLLLIAMLCNERNNNACCCNGNSPNIVPIPYPIPMPIYSPVFCSSCGNYIDDDDDDDDYKQKKGNRSRREDLEAWDKHTEYEVQ